MKSSMNEFDDHNTIVTIKIIIFAWVIITYNINKRIRNNIVTNVSFQGFLPHVFEKRVDWINRFQRNFDSLLEKKLYSIL